VGASTVKTIKLLLLHERVLRYTSVESGSGIFLDLVNEGYSLPGIPVICHANVEVGLVPNHKDRRCFSLLVKSKHLHSVLGSIIAILVVVSIECKQTIAILLKTHLVCDNLYRDHYFDFLPNDIYERDEHFSSGNNVWVDICHGRGFNYPMDRH